jgi:hypothetical protein
MPQAAAFLHDNNKVRTSELDYMAVREAVGYPPDEERVSS